MAELGTRCAIERAQTGNPPPNAARTSDLPEPLVRRNVGPEKYT